MAEQSPERALTLTQPWATLMVTGAKRIETRSWRTRHRGLLGIHAAQGFPRQAITRCFEEPFTSSLKAAGITKPAELPRGALIGWVYVTDCVPTDGMELIGISDRERAFGDYSPGRFGWLTTRFGSFEPIPMKGALSIWEVPRL